MWKIEIPTDSVPKFELGDTVADTQQRREEREAREREVAQKQREEEARMEEARRELQKSVQRQTKVTLKQSLEKRWEHYSHVTNIYLTDSDEEAIVYFVKDHKELYDKTNEHFKDKVRKKCLWERFANSRKLSVKVWKTWFGSQRTCYGKLMQSKTG